MRQPHFARCHQTAIFDSTPVYKMKGFEAMQPGGRLGDPEEMAEIIAFLLSDEASYVNATVVSGHRGACVFKSVLLIQIGFSSAPVFSSHQALPKVPPI